MFGDYLQNGYYESWNILRHPEMIERWTYYHDLFRSPLNVFAQYLVFWLPCSRWTCLITKQGRPGHFTSWIQVWHEFEETVRILDKAGVAPDLMLDVLIVVSLGFRGFAIVRFDIFGHTCIHVWTYYCSSPPWNRVWSQTCSEEHIQWALGWKHQKSHAYYTLRQISTRITSRNESSNPLFVRVQVGCGAYLRFEVSVFAPMVGALF